VVSAQLTPRAKRFAGINRVFGIVMSEWLDKDRKQPTGTPETWVKMRFRFSNMQQITLHKDDLDSLRANGVDPVWWNAHRRRGADA
jgi:hypothetical protein